MLLLESHDVESFFSEQEDYDDQTSFVLVEIECSDPENVSVIQTVQQIQKVQPAICYANFNVLASARIYCSVNQW